MKGIPWHIFPTAFSSCPSALTRDLSPTKTQDAWLPHLMKLKLWCLIAKIQRERKQYELDLLRYKSRKSRKTWSNRQIWTCNTEWSRAKSNRVLPRKCTGHSKHPLPTTQEKILHMDITRWSTPKSDWLHSLQPKMEKLYTVSKNQTGSWLCLRSWTPYCQIQIEI